jgi:hypothetical protein
MVPVLVFLGVATAIGFLIRGFVGLRLRAVSRRTDVSDADLCELRQANRISSAAVITSLAALAVVAGLFVVL